MTAAAWLGRPQPPSTLVVMRHGPYRTDAKGVQHLSGAGKQMAIGWGQLLASEYGSRSVAVVTSFEKRAIETGDVIAKIFRVKTEQVDWLVSSNYDTPDIRSEGRIRLQAMPSGSVLILVTHLPQIMDYNSRRGVACGRKINYCEIFKENFLI